MSVLGIGIIGTGTWGTVHARTYAAMHGVRVLGVADLVAGRAEALANATAAAAYMDYRELLANDAIQAVSIVTPDFAHAEIALAAAEAGKHILCEKPLAMTVQQCEAIVMAAEKAGVKLMVDFHARWSPPLYKARQTIQNGDIGVPQHVYYRLSDRVHVPSKMLSWAGQSTVMWFIGSHSIDTIRWLLDDEVTRVYAVARSEVLKNMGIDTPDYYQATLHFRAGATAQLENSWILPDSQPSLIDLKCEVVGSKGAIYMDASHNRTLEKYTGKEASYPDILVMPTVYGRQMGFAAESIRHFAECVRDGKELLVTGRDGLQVTKAICAIEESVRSGHPVTVD
ncbi:MAG TPA: Gfo/Idh/MocA family oxidoreductase [Candidatus Hydrogenedentes bacterium]|nr:Gfo/Idh/MocA family oxidoreductase [Candidatus Hydrogenedentota bacterium]HQM51309.1 Gfo/Idh/MocA family oxidoreductase [Candidatus Hydrogenedentota bacterium]